MAGRPGQWAGTVGAGLELPVLSAQMESCNGRRRPTVNRLQSNEVPMFLGSPPWGGKSQEILS